MQITCEFHYDSAHWLPNVPDGHKCGRLHGHTYTLTVVVGGDVGADTGWVMDFADIKDTIRPWLARLDHRQLNDEIPNPTVELQMLWWWERLNRSIPGLVELRLREGMSNTAIYRGEEARVKTSTVGEVRSLGQGDPCLPHGRVDCPECMRFRHWVAQ